jgi:diguanylate cyclase (GGDEF)-like protein
MRLALREIGPEFHLTWADGLTSALELAGRERFDVILLDPSLADISGPDAVRHLREAAPDAPLLLLASAAHVGLCLRAMEQGAHDYLFKDVLTTHLLARMIHDAVDRSRGGAAVGGHLLDAVTGLANREGLEAQAAQLWRSPTRLRKGATVLFLTLDGLAVINAARGTAVGDRALVEAADILRDTFRGSDLRARLDGADFAVLAVGAPEATAPILTARLEEAVQGCNALDERDYYLLLRVGMAHYAPERPCAFEEMLRAAESRVGEARLGRRPTASPVAAV